MGTGGGSRAQSAARVLRGGGVNHAVGTANPQSPLGVSGTFCVLRTFACVCVCVCIRIFSSYYFKAKETGGDMLSRPATGVSRGVSGKSFLSTTAYRIQPAAVGSKGGRGEACSLHCGTWKPTRILRVSSTGGGRGEASPPNSPASPPRISMSNTFM